MDVIKKWVGWILFAAMVLFFVAMSQEGALDELFNKLTDKVPSVTVNK